MGTAFTLDSRLAALRAAKLAQTQEKQSLIGSMDHDDWALVLPPPDRRRVVQAISSSGMPITDVLLQGYEVEANHPSGGFYGPRACGRNYRRLLEQHPTYIDPNSSLAGAYMVNFMSYRKQHWPPDLQPSAHLQAEIARYRLLPGIGATQHFCQDLQIGLEQGWGGILARIRRFAPLHPDAADFYAGLEDVVLGLQNWIGRHAAEARRLAQLYAEPPAPLPSASGDERQADSYPIALGDQEAASAVRANLAEMAEINERLVSEPPRTFREACQWILWFQMAARMYNGSGSLGRLDVLLLPYYERERAAGTLSDEEAVFHIACLLLRDTAYLQLGGPDEQGRDVTNPVSFLVLEAAHRLRIPANVGVCVGDGVDPQLLRRGVEILCSDRTGIPKFLGIENTTAGFARNGYPLDVARQRAYSGCHWSAIPGREYTLNDCVKINLGPVFDVALREMLADTSVTPGTAELWRRFEAHLRRAVRATADCLDFHVAHMHQVFPELVMDLLCHGPIERGLDASHGGVEYTNLCIDAAALATVADSFAALEIRVEQEGRLSWHEVLAYLDSDWAGAEGERARLMMRSISRYGTGGARADGWARRTAEAFTRLVKESPTPAGYNLIPGIFSWANTIPMGRELGATPNGRHAGAPISHGSNPDPGFRRDGAPTALAAAVASVQPGWGNTAPLQIELDPALPRGPHGVELIEDLIRTHFRLGGTQINMNIMDRAQVLEAHQDPSKYPDLIVRVTGFSAYFASLSPEFRQLVVDRIIAEGA